MLEEIPTVIDMGKMLQKVRIGMSDLKPNDRTNVDRSFAICITDIEKLIAYFDYYIAKKSDGKYTFDE